MIKAIAEENKLLVRKAVEVIFNNWCKHSLKNINHQVTNSIAHMLRRLKEIANTSKSIAWFIKVSGWHYNGRRQLCNGTWQILGIGGPN